MTPANSLFVAVGAIALLAGLALMLRPLPIGRRMGFTDDERARHALLIAGMMLAAFGLVLGGFAIAYTMTSPLDLNSASSAR